MRAAEQRLRTAEQQVRQERIRMYRAARAWPGANGRLAPASAPPSGAPIGAAVYEARRHLGA
jgi:hypothetical protein